jgi:putative ABC transport system substrate-binding protein
VAHVTVAMPPAAYYWQSEGLMPVRRRHVIQALGLDGLALASGCGVVPAPAPAPDVPRIGFLGAGSATNTSTREFLAGMRDLGYVEGQTVHIDWRFDEGRPERLPDLAAELVRLTPDVLVAGASTPPAVAAKRATGTIPIVFMGVSDPIGSGLIAAFAHPEGNATGTSNISAEVGPNRLQMVKEMR